MNPDRKKLLQECVPHRCLDGFEADSVSARHSHISLDDITIIDNTANIGQTMGLEVDADDIEERSIELSTEGH